MLLNTDLSNRLDASLTRNMDSDAHKLTFVDVLVNGKPTDAFAGVPDLSVLLARRLEAILPYVDSANADRIRSIIDNVNASIDTTMAFVCE